jgi:hypothetical protein
MAKIIQLIPYRWSFLRNWKHRWSRNFSPFIKLEGSQVPNTGPCPEPIESSPELLLLLWEPPTMQTDYSRRYQKVGGICTLRIIKIFRRRYPTSSSS